MGQLFNRFGSLQLANEAEVSQNFLIPLLQEFLGYDLSEILPEHLYPSFNIPLNRDKSIKSDAVERRIRPDYVVKINDSIVLSCDAKGPDQKLDDHLHQLKAYCIALGTNLILVTNALELRIYDANELVFQSVGIEDLDLKFLELKKLIGRDIVPTNSTLKRIQSLDLARTLGSHISALQNEKAQIALFLSDFENHLKSVQNSKSDLQLPVPIRDAFGIDLHRLPPEDVYSFEERNADKHRSRAIDSIPYRTIIKHGPIPLLLIGESGIGKSSLLQKIQQDQAELCLAYESAQVPLLIKLGLYTHNRSLVEMIGDSLAEYGANVNRSDILSLFRTGRLMLLLDAYDEVFEAEITYLERELQALIENYRSCTIIVTTRHFRIPNISPLRQLEVLRLSETKIEMIASLYLGVSFNNFHRELLSKRVGGLATNTLLLILLILHFRRNGTLPRTRGKLLQGIVEQVQRVDRAKLERFASPLPWDIKFVMLARLSSIALEKGASYAIDLTVVELTIMHCLTESEASRKIPVGVTLEQAIESLASTGFVLSTKEGLIFWHRAFLEYFACFDLSKRLEADPELLLSLIVNPVMQGIIPITISLMPDPVVYLERLSRLNIFAAAQALLESPNESGPGHEAIVNKLIAKCNSTTISIRRRAISLLQSFADNYTSQQFYRLLSSPFVDIQKAALVEVARRKLPNARELIFKRLEWDESAPTWSEGPSTGAVIEALGELDEEEAYLQIIQMWQSKPDMFTDMYCEATLIDAIRRNIITHPVKTALLDLFVRNDPDWHPYHKLWGISKVIIALADEAMAPRILSAVQTTSSESEYFLSTAGDVISSFTSASTIEAVIDSLFEGTVNENVRVFLAKALTRSAGDVPRHVFEKLSLDPDFSVRSEGIRGLGRFSFRETKEIVLSAIHPPLERYLPTHHKYALVQKAVIEVLAKHGQLNLLLQAEYQPDFYYFIAIEALSEAIVANNLLEMAPLLESFLNQSTHPEVSLKIACSLANIGLTHHAHELIEELQQNGALKSKPVIREVLAEVHLLSPGVALSIVDDLLGNAGVAKESDAHQLRHTCIEALERIGTAEAQERLCSIARMCIVEDDSFDSERALRGIASLASKDREEWLLDLINQYSTMNKHALRRVLEALGYIGTNSSIPVLKRYFDSTPSGEIQIICFEGLRSIYERQGLVWYNGEESSEL